MKTVIFMLCFWVCGLPALGLAQTRSTSFDSGSVEPAQTFNSHARVKAKLGAAVADSLKDFDFSKNTLIWVPTTFDKDARIEIAQVPVSRCGTQSRIRKMLWRGYDLEAVRSGSKFEIFQIRDNSCKGGECAAKVQKSVAAARKRILLFSTPKTGLSSVKLTRIVAPDQP
ncbi:MAG: hypothetical protein R3E66_13540 [bacterium]